MKQYTVCAASLKSHPHPHPERTAYRNAGTGMNFDKVCQVWSNRAAMAKSIRMQEAREPKWNDWSALVPLSPGEGH